MILTKKTNKTMNKFESILADNTSKTLSRRASSLSSQAEIAAQTVVNDLKNKVNELQLKVDNLTDFAPNTSDSLRPGTDDWKPLEWARELQRTKWDLKIAKEQLEVAKETYNEYFVEKVDTKASKDEKEDK